MSSRKKKKKKKKKKNTFGLYEILPFPRQPIVQIEFWQYT